MSVGAQAAPKLLQYSKNALLGVEPVLEYLVKKEADGSITDEEVKLQENLLVVQWNLEQLTNECKKAVEHAERMGKVAEATIPPRGRPSGTGMNPTVGPMSPEGGTSPAAVPFLKALRLARPHAKKGAQFAIANWHTSLTDLRRIAPEDADRVPGLNEEDPDWD